MRTKAAIVCAFFVMPIVGVAPAAAAGPRIPAAPAVPPPLVLPDRSTVTTTTDGIVTRVDKHGKRMTFVLPGQQAKVRSFEPTGIGAAEVTRATWQRLHGRYRPGHVLVAFRSGVSGAGMAAQFARHVASVGDPTLDTALRVVGAASMKPLFGSASSARLGLASQRARMTLGSRALDLNNLYDVHIGALNPFEAAQALRRSRSVAYAEPDFYVSTMLAHDGVYAQGAQQRAQAHARTLRAAAAARRATASVATPALPTNYGLQSSLSAFLNANNLDWTPAYVQLQQKYGQLPGEGEIITNVSIGDITDPSQGLSDGSTSTVIGGQRYLDIPTMPLIPTYVADLNANLDPLGTVVGSQDPLDGEILLDFSVMAPLPDSMQRPQRLGFGLLDPLGIAPGAQYRLVVPGQETFSNIAAAILGASQQAPAPNVITASLGFGTDGFGFPGRYLEDDPIIQSIIASIVNSGIVVCISSNDGTRIATNAAVNPDGGSTPTDLAPPNTGQTTIDDVQLSTTPSLEVDSGAIDVGASTLDDTITWDTFNPGPQRAIAAYAQTRISGLTAYSSGFGARVNVSAPGDAIPAMQHFPCPTCTAQYVYPANEAGTSASAPEVAASAAVVLQAARLAGKPLTPAGVRALLASTGHPVPTPPQIDRQLNVGPLVDLGAAVGSLLGPGAQPSVPRIAIAERQEYALDGGEFEEDTDPSLIDLQGPDTPFPTGTNTFSPITIAPDWVGLPAGARYSLFVTGHPGSALATTSWARLVPEQILTAAGLALVSPLQRTVSLTYRAMQGQHIVREATFGVTFSPSDGTSVVPPAPVVPVGATVGQPVTVSYDLSHTSVLLAPQLIVSNLDHWSFAAAPQFRISYAMRLLNLKGTVTLPASAFVGGSGLYGIAIENDSVNKFAGHVAPIHLAGASEARPAAPTLQALPTDVPAHGLQIVRPQTAFYANYDVSNVPNATGAVLEISAAGPNIYSNLNNINNPFGNQQDNNGFDTPSVFYQPLSGQHGTAQLDAGRLGLQSSMYYVVRVLPANGTTIVGTASPVSTLQFSDVSTPGGAFVSGFDIVPGATSSVSTFDYYNGGGAYIYPYTPSTETYGQAWYSDPSGNSEVAVFGSDPSLNRTAAWTYNVPAGTYGIVALDQTSGQIVGQATVPPGFVTDQQVDPVRHRALFISDNSGSTSLIPFDLNALTTGSSISLGGPRWSSAGPPTALTIDRSTGVAYGLASLVRGGRCLQDAMARIDVGAGTVSTPAAIGYCDVTPISDGHGQSVFVADGPPYSEFFSNLPLLNDVGKIDANTLAFTQMPATAGYGAVTMAVDSVNQLLLVAYLASPRGPSDNSGAGTLGEYDLASGRLIKSLPSFNFGFVVSGIPAPAGSLQLDPSTRTGWTYGSDGAEVRQFSY